MTTGVVNDVVIFGCQTLYLIENCLSLGYLCKKERRIEERSEKQENREHKNL